MATAEAKPFLLDGEAVTASELIAAAKVEGYRGDGCMYFTSEAAGVLRASGHEVAERAKRQKGATDG